MFSGRSERSLDRVVATHPEWKDPIARILGILGDVPRGGLIDPSLVAKLARLSRLETLGFLHVLQDARLGRIITRVVDNAGLEVRRFRSVADIPDRVTDEYGEEVRVMPENIDIAFEPTAAVAAAGA
jgi:hypothetical protein